MTNLQKFKKELEDAENAVIDAEIDYSTKKDLFENRKKKVEKCSNCQRKSFFVHKEENAGFCVDCGMFESWF